MIEEAADTYRKASTGKMFKIENISTNDYGELPVSVWNNDTRTKKQLLKQALVNLRSRKLIHKVADIKASKSKSRGDEIESEIPTSDNNTDTKKSESSVSKNTKSIKKLIV